MITPSTFFDKKTIAELTARMYLDTGAVRFMQDKPFIFTSGWASPVYNDSRWLISFPDVRSTLMDFTIACIKREIGREAIDAVAGGETAAFPSRLGLQTGFRCPCNTYEKNRRALAAMHRSRGN